MNILKTKFPLMCSSAVIYFALGAPAEAITVSGDTENDQQTVSADDKLEIGLGGKLSVNGTAIKSNSASTGVEIINKGLIESVEEGGRAINVGGSDDLIRNINIFNEKGALVTAQNDAIRVNVDVKSGMINVINSGEIISTAGGQAIDFDAVETAAGGQILIENRTAGVIRADDADAIRPGANGTVTNSGLIYAETKDGGASDGIDFQSHSGSVYNLTAGSISGARHGITSSSNITVLNEKGAEIIGRNGSGVGSDGDGIVYNYGLISGDYVGFGNGDGDGVDIDGNAYIENWGEIRATGAGGVDKGGEFNYSEAIAIGGGTLINHIGGVIQSPNGVVIGDLSAVIENDGLIKSDVYALAANSQIYLINRGSIEGGYAGAVYLVGNGNDTIIASGSFTGTGDRVIFMGGGDDSIYVQQGASFNGSIDGGDGQDSLMMENGSTINVSVLNFEKLFVDGSASLLTDNEFASTYIKSDAVLTVGDPEKSVVLKTDLFMESGSSFDLQAGSTLQAMGKVALTGTDGSERVINRGRIVGNLMLGSGDDVFEAYAGSSVAGVVDAGAGVDRVAFHLGAATSAPTAINLAPYTGFEQLALESGVGSLVGRADFDSIWVNGGHLIGLAGSTMNAASGITVARGAIFGSAGTVNGDVVVQGTLSPGASPGTMTVNGNVALTTGSTTLFEMTPTVSDALVINGNLSIANGSTLQIVGERPLTPGVTYHLISTTGGITGTFSTIDKAQSVFGYIFQTADSLDLLSTLQVRAGAGRPVSAAIVYINDLLIGGNASAQMIAAMPQLTDADGYVDAKLAGTLHPEAYAAASQIGIENGLAISSALRSAQRISDAQGSGFFMLGQGLGSWQNMRANAARGVAKVNQSSGGFLGGIGYQTGDLALSAFAGRIYANQSITTIGARTKADGTFAGAAAVFTHGGFDVGGAVIWDGSSAKTRRVLFDGTTAIGRYDLRSVTFDAHGGYGFALGKGGWRLGPELGVTHIRVKRGHAEEIGNEVFALDVESKKQDATFLSADVRLDMASSERLRPWLTAGWRRRLRGDTTLATAGFTGISGEFSVFGAERDRDYAQVGGGFDWAVTQGVTLFARGSSAFTGANAVTNVSGGVRLGI